MWEIITTKGRLLTGVQVRFENGDLHISWVKMAKGEAVAILLDRARNQVRLFAPFEDCKALAAKHGYELAVPRQPEESLLEHVQRFLAMS
jgi:hypothetical protein